MRGYHLTVKHAFAGVYVLGEKLEDGEIIAREYISKRHWIISGVEADGFAYNPALHDLPDEASALCHYAQQNGAAMGLVAVGFAPDGGSADLRN
jgi:hypothetical protein